MRIDTTNIANTNIKPGFKSLQLDMSISYIATQINTLSQMAFMYTAAMPEFPVVSTNAV